MVLKQALIGLLLVANSHWQITKLRRRCKQVRVGAHFRSFGPMTLFCAPSAQLCIGEQVTFRNTTASNFVGIYKPSSLYVGNGARLTIGKGTGLSGVSIYCSLSISIGDHCTIGANCSLWDTDFHPLDAQKRRDYEQQATKSATIAIGNDVFVGAHSIILKGVTIGERAIIGAGSVVSCSIPADEIWAGNPARFIRTVYEGDKSSGGSCP